jgi:hypothetical protein
MRKAVRKTESKPPKTPRRSVTTSRLVFTDPLYFVWMYNRLFGHLQEGRGCVSLENTLLMALGNPGFKFIFRT